MAKRNITIGVIAVKLPASLKALPSSFKKQYVAKCKELNATMAAELKGFIANNAPKTGVTGTGKTRGRKTNG